MPAESWLKTNLCLPCCVVQLTEAYPQNICSLLYNRIKIMQFCSVTMRGYRGISFYYLHMNRIASVLTLNSSFHVALYNLYNNITSCRDDSICNSQSVDIILNSSVQFLPPPSFPPLPPFSLMEITVDYIRLYVCFSRLIHVILKIIVS